MTKLCYLQCQAGASGDMLLAAAIDAGASLGAVQEAISLLALPGTELKCGQVIREGIATSQIKVCTTAEQSFRHLADLVEIVDASPLSTWVKKQARAIFGIIARAEAKVHGCSLESVHFHEVGAVDTIVDVVGVLVALELLGVERIFSSPLPQPHGFVHCSHGKIPLPAPAVCEILQGIPCYGVDVATEMVTPTGAALIAVLADEFGPMPTMCLQATGYGSGSREYSGDMPNFLRLFCGDSVDSDCCDEVEVVETNLDDCNPEHLPYLLEKLFAVGALDVSYSSIVMKKGRLGYALTVLTPPQYGKLVRQTIFAQSSTIGLRYRREKRELLPRRIGQIASPWGPLTVKEVRRNGRWQQLPEFEACKLVAEAAGIPLADIYKYVGES